MGEIDKYTLRELIEAVGHLDRSENKKKQSKIVKDKKQFRVSIPKRFAEAMKIDQERDHFEFELIPDRVNKDLFSLEAKLVKG